MSKQMRVSDKHFGEIANLADDLGLKRSEILGISIGILKSLRGQQAKTVKILKDDGTEVELILTVDLTS